MTIASVTFVHAHSIFLLPHLEMLKGMVDKRIVVYGRTMWPPYLAEHGKLANDNTLELLKGLKDVEVYETDIVQHDGPSFADVYNYGVFLSRDYDYSMRLDVDMYFDKENKIKLSKFIRETQADMITMDHQVNTINYYVDFDHGLKDAKEYESLCLSTKNKYVNYLIPEKQDKIITIPQDILVHHFRGWNKPKSTDKRFFESEYAKKQLETQEWLKCPVEIRNMVRESAKPWLELIK